MENEDESNKKIDLEKIFESQEYNKANLSVKNEILVKAIRENFELFNKKSDKPILDSKYILPENKNNIILENKGSLAFLDVNCSSLENISLSDFEHILPREGDLLFDKKINYIKINLRKILDNYDLMIYELKEDNDMLHYLLECKREVEEKLSFVHNYILKEEIQIKKYENVDIVYFIYNGKNVFLDDLLNDDSEKYSSYLLLLESIRNQNYKNIKRITNRNYNFSGFEVRNSEQRIIFDFLTPTTIIILQAFTKKVTMSKKYSCNLYSRLLKYDEEKSKFRARVLSNYEDFINKYNSDDDIIMELLTSKNKKMVKKGVFNE